jgi:hypothetical protein
MRWPMKRLIPILLIFLTFSLLQFGRKKETKKITPKIGLLTFSVNAFDEESKKINAGLKAVKGVIDRELKKSFHIVEKTSDEITYSDIELPEVTIDPGVEPETNKKLEKLCKQDWDGLVFGHFHQEDKLIVVTRFYLSKKKYPSIKKDERIISSPEIEIPTTNLGKKSLESHTTQSIQELIESIKTKRPEVFGLVKKKAAATPDTKKPKEQKKLPEQKESKRQKKTKIGQKGKDKEGKKGYEIETLTAKDVYQMIIDNGFYCEIVKGSQFHEDGLKDIKKRPKNSIFSLKRIIDAQRKGDDVIRTISIKDFESPKGEKKIELLWYTKSLQYCSYKKAIEIINNLNNKETKKRKWRIPTVMELLSITRHDTTDHFPYIFKFHEYFQKKELVFWTSTAFKGTHCVIKSTYDKSKKIYWLHFSFMNIKRKNKALILPVYSEKVYLYENKIPGFDGTTKKSTSTSRGADKIPGFDNPLKKSTGKKSVPSTPPKSGSSKKSDTISPKSKTPDKIPGFDDNPDPPKRKLPKTISSRSNNTKRFLPKNRIKLNILLFPVVDDEKMKNRGKFVFPTQFNESVKLTLEELKEELIKNCELKIIEISHSYIHIIRQFYRIILNNRISKDRKLFEITDKIIVPPTFTDIDIVVAGRCFKLGGVYVSSTYLIDLINYDIPVIHSGGSSDFWEHIEFIKKKINEIIKNRPVRIIRKKVKIASEIE